VRSEDQIRYQQFSTPLDLAGLVVLLAQVKPTDVVLDAAPATVAWSRCFQH